MAKPKIRIGDLARTGVPAQEGSIILVAASGMGGKMTYRTAPPTVITNGGTQRDRGIEIDYPPRPRPKTRNLKKKRT